MRCRCGGSMPCVQGLVLKPLGKILLDVFEILATTGSCWLVCSVGLKRSRCGLVCMSCGCSRKVSLAGGPDNQVHFEGYQVSNQCMALVRDECLLPCKDAPELGYVKESSSEQYVPDVFYKVNTRWASSGRRPCGPWPAWAPPGSGAFWPPGPLVSCSGLVSAVNEGVQGSVGPVTGSGHGFAGSGV